MSYQQSAVIPMIKPAEMALDDFLAALPALGMAGVETWGSMEQLEQTAEACARQGVRLVNVIGHASLERGLNQPEEHDRIEAELAAALDFAARHGVPNVIAFSGVRRPEQSDAEGLAACARGLRRIAPLAEEKRITINIEVLNSRIDHSGYQCDRVDWAIALCQLVDSPYVKLLFDVYHVAIMEGDLIRNLRKSAPYLGHIHTAGNPGRSNLNDTQEINYPAIAVTLRDLGYARWVGHEFTPTGPWDAALREAVGQF